MAAYEVLGRAVSAHQVQLAGEVGVRSRTELGDEGLAYQAGRARAGALLAAGDLDGVDRLTEREARAARERNAPHRGWLSLRLRSAGSSDSPMVPGRS